VIEEGIREVTPYYFIYVDNLGILRRVIIEE
jgi:hypothetical protein